MSEDYSAWCEAPRGHDGDHLWGPANSNDPAAPYMCRALPHPEGRSELAYLRERWWAVRDLLLQWDREQEVIKNILAAVTDQPRVDAMALAQMAMVDELRAIVESAP